MPVSCRLTTQPNRRRNRVGFREIRCRELNAGCGGRARIIILHPIDFAILIVSSVESPASGYSVVPPHLWMYLCKNGKNLISHSLNNNDSMA